MFAEVSLHLVKKIATDN